MNKLKLLETKVMPTNTASKPVTDTVGIYLREIGRIPLLSQEQEVLFGQQVQQMMKILDVKEKLMVQLKRSPTLQELAQQMHSSEEELRQQLHQGKIAKQKMITANLRLVVSIAKQYLKRNLDFLDLIQEGTLGLERGVEKFDPTRGYKFSTYAYWWIRQGITRAIAQQGRAIRLPIHINEKLNKIKLVQRDLSQKLGRIPTVGEIAEALDLEPSQIRDYLLVARKPVSLDMRVGSERDTELQDLIEDPSSVNNNSGEEFLSQDIHDLLAKLSPQQQQVIKLRFGLIDGNELSLTEIGQRMGVSRERVRQIEKYALSLLQKQLIKPEVKRTKKQFSRNLPRLIS